MKLISLESGGVGIETGDELLAVEVPAAWGGTGGSPMRRLISKGPGALDSLLGDAVRVPTLAPGTARMPPIPDPSKIVAAPVNYRDHAEEMAQTTDVRNQGVFLKAPSSLIGSGGTVQLPYSDRRFDQEGELAVVIGRTARHVSPDEALDHVFGYLCLLDITMRGGHEDRSLRKSFDSFTPIGPHIVTADEIPDPGALKLRCSVSGVLRQDASTANLIFDVPRLLSYASSVMTLQPGDIVTTGTPAGVGPIAGGDEVTVEIDGVGVLTVHVSGATDARCPTGSD
jgi:2-keto-4-pentenoate hydratase/2-oxohepta-3-ene-1,7-dioic acid hydratase in catechol pathway